ncbi:hypothetical protein VTN96DRAFT_8715 [Rasamsonia emersonii]
MPRSPQGGCSDGSPRRTQERRQSELQGYLHAIQKPWYSELHEACPRAIQAPHCGYLHRHRVNNLDPCFPIA